MRFATTFLFTFLFVFAMTGQDYYWIGGGGNWIDINHWATSSGGDTLHTVLPDSTNNVFFDENSFSEEEEEVKFAYPGLSCLNITISGTTLKPVFKATDYYDDFYIHGDFVATSEMSWFVIYNYLVGNAESKIAIPHEGFRGTLFVIPRDSMARFDLASDLIVEDIEIRKGIFDTNGFDISAGKFAVGKRADYGIPSAILNNSRIDARSAVFSDFAFLEAGTSEIFVKDPPGATSVLFFGGGHDFHHVSFEGRIDRIKDNNHFVEFTAMPGSTLSFEDGHTQTAEKFNFQGTSSAPISLDNRTEGSFAYLHQSEGEVNGNYMTLKDNSAGEEQYLRQKIV